jgi:hypothetical protein
MELNAIVNLYKKDCTQDGDIILIEGKAPTAAQWTEIKAEVVRLKDESVRRTQIKTLTAAYTAAIQLPVAYMSTTFQTDTASQDVLTKCLVAGSVPAGFYWLDATNAQVAMTFTELQGLAGTILAQGQVAFDKLQTKKTAVRDATTVADIEAVVW